MIIKDRNQHDLLYERHLPAETLKLKHGLSSSCPSPKLQFLFQETTGLFQFKVIASKSGEPNKVSKFNSYKKNHSGTC